MATYVFGSLLAAIVVGFVLCDDHLSQQTLRHMFAMIVGEELRFTAGIIDNQISILFFCRV